MAKIRNANNTVPSSTGHNRAKALIPTLNACELCGKPAIDRHHKDGNWANNKRDNIQMLCRRCHMTIDGRLDALRERLSNRGVQEPKQCAGCERPYKPLRRGLCPRCYDHTYRKDRNWRKGKTGRA